jgi:hypothetical protein
MVDRVLVYPGALPQTVDQLYTNKFGMVGQAHQNRSILGTSTVVSGLACTPTSPTADLHVQIGVGAIYQMDPTDQAAYGDLGVDNTSIMKQGILNAPISLTITPPGTVGFSQVFLVEAILNDVDAGQMVLSYYNSANPASPYSGPANSGTSNFTTRTCPCVVALKAGVAATTGTQTTPAPDAGYVGLYAVTVVNGQTQITSPNIVQVPTAPFFPTLPAVPLDVQSGMWVYANDTGAVNAMVVTLSPIPTAYVAGMGIRVKAANTITSVTVTINVNGLGNVTIKRASGAALIFTPTPDITSGQVIDLVYDGVNFQIANYLGIASGAVTNNFNAVGAPYVVDTGVTNALIGIYSPAITSGQQVAGLILSIKLANTITGACTINVNSLGVKNLLTGDLQNIPNSVYVAGQILLIVYDGTQYSIINTSSLTFRKPSANLSIYVNTAIGNDANDGVSNTAGHALKTIQAGVNLAWSYAPSQFLITIVVEPGTYNENVSTPLYAGPAIIIDGLVASSVVVSAGNNVNFQILGPNTVTIRNLTVVNNGLYPNHGFVASQGSSVTVTNCISQTIGCGVFASYSGANLTVVNHTYSGSSMALWWLGAGGNIILTTGTQTFSGAISVSTASCVSAAGTLSLQVPGPPVFVNPAFVSGLKYSLNLNGVIWASGLGVNIIPGTVAGTLSNGGQVQF